MREGRSAADDADVVEKGAARASEGVSVERTAGRDEARRAAVGARMGVLRSMFGAVRSKMSPSMGGMLEKAGRGLVREYIKRKAVLAGRSPDLHPEEGVTAFIARRFSTPSIDDDFAPATRPSLGRWDSSYGHSAARRSIVCIRVGVSSAALHPASACLAVVGKRRDDVALQSARRAWLGPCVRVWSGASLGSEARRVHAGVSSESHGRSGACQADLAQRGSASVVSQSSQNNRLVGSDGDGDGDDELPSVDGSRPSYPRSVAGGDEIGGKELVPRPRGYAPRRSAICQSVSCTCPGRQGVRAMALIDGNGRRLD